MVTEQERSHAIATRPRPSHAVRKDKSVRTIGADPRRGAIVPLSRTKATFICIASCERSFSKLKLVLSYFRPSMTNNKSGQVL